MGGMSSLFHVNTFPPVLLRVSYIAAINFARAQNFTVRMRVGVKQALIKNSAYCSKRREGARFGAGQGPSVEKTCFWPSVACSNTP